MGQLEQTPHLKRYALKMELKKKNGAKEKFMRKRIWAVTLQGNPLPTPKEV